MEFGQPVVQAFTSRDYEADPQVWASATDARGLVYLGNKGCVLEYDGATWRRIPIGTTIYVRAVALAPDGRLYVGGVDELGYLEEDAFGQKQFVSLRDRLPAEDRNLGAIWGIDANRDGIYFSAGSHVLRWHDGRFDVWRDPNPQTFQRVRGDGQRIYVKIGGQPFERFDGDRRIEVTRDPRILRSVFVTALPDGRDGALIYVSTSHGLWRIDAKGNVEPFTTEIDTVLRQESAVVTAVRGPDGSIVLGLAKSGVVQLDAHGRFLRRIGLAEGLPNSLARVGAIDRAGGLWVGTNKGAARVMLGGPRTFFGAAQGLAGASVTGVTRHHGQLHVATSGGVFRLLPRSAATPENAHFEAVPGPGASMIFTIASAPDGLLAAENDRLLAWRDGAKEGTLVLRAPTVLDLAPSAQEPGVFWGASGSGAGLARIAWHDGQWHAERPFGGLAGNFHNVVEDAHGDLWLATALRGLWRVEFGPAPSTGAARPIARVTHFAPGEALPSPLGEISVAVREGEPVFSLAGERWRFARAQKKPVRDLAAPAAIPADWLATMPGANPDSASARREGALWWLGANETFERFDPTALTAPPEARAIVRGVTCASRNPWPADARLAAGRQDLTFHFTALPTVHPAQLQTRLRGFDDAWSEPSVARARVYTNLPSGDYAFLVRARDGTGPWGPETELAFTMLPSWWATWWSRVGFGLAATSAVVGLVRWRGHALRRRNEQLTALVNARTLELREARDAAEAANRAKSAFLANMSHELRTPLNGVLGYAQILRRDTTLPEPQRARASVIARSGEHLLGLINDVLDLAKVEAGHLERHETDCDLRAIVRGVAELLSVRAET